MATLPPNPPADELAELALAGEITDSGAVTVDCIGEKNGKPGLVCPEELPRAVRGAFIAECGRRGLPITRTDMVTVN